MNRWSWKRGFVAGALIAYALLLFAHLMAGEIAGWWERLTQ